MVSFKKCIIAAITFSCAISPSQAEIVTILHTNDTHSAIEPYDNGLGGILRRKVVIDSVRAENPATLVIDLGDVVQGSLYYNVYKGEVEEKMMNALGYDMRILGNHEFDNGMEMLANNLAMSEAELLCSNYKIQGTDLAGLFKPYSIHKIGGKRIAFMPINLKPHGMISDLNTVGMEYVDQFATAQNLAWYLKNIEECDYVIALTHIGYDEDVQLLQQSTDIDMLLGGHSHTLVDPADPSTPPHIVKNADGRDILIAQLDKGGQHIGQITFDTDNLDQLPTSKVITVDARLDSRIDPALEQMLQPYRNGVDALDTNIIGRSVNGMDQKSPELLNFMSDRAMQRGQQLAERVQLAIINRGGLRTSMPKGNVAEGNIMTIAPFQNRYVVIDIAGDKLLETFDIIARQGGQGVSDNVDALIDPETQKCTTLTISGKTIDPKATYRLVTLDYLAQGGDYMEPLRSGVVVASSPNCVYDDVIALIKADKKLSQHIDGSKTKRMRTK